MEQFQDYMPAMGRICLRHCVWMGCQKVQKALQLSVTIPILEGGFGCIGSYSTCQRLCAICRLMLILPTTKESRGLMRGGQMIGEAHAHQSEDIDIHLICMPY